MKKKIAIIVQARLGSKRFPNKIIKKIKGKFLIYRILERLVHCKLTNTIILAMPNKKREREKVKKLNFKKIKFFFGSENNVLKRYYLASKKFGIETVVRFPGDNALPDPVEIDRIISYYSKFKKPFFATNIQNVFNNNYPDGIGAEVFSFKHLKQLMEKKLPKIYKEHIHLNFFDYKKQKEKNSAWCKVRTLKCPKSKSYKKLKLDINYPRDYIFIKKIYNKLYDNKKMFSTLDIIKFLNLKKS